MLDDRGMRAGAPPDRDREEMPEGDAKGDTGENSGE
jgi:hypothetical protein